MKAGVGVKMGRNSGAEVGVRLGRKTGVGAEVKLGKRKIGAGVGVKI